MGVKNVLLNTVTIIEATRICAAHNIGVMLEIGDVMCDVAKRAWSRLSHASRLS